MGGQFLRSEGGSGQRGSFLFRIAPSQPYTSSVPATALAMRVTGVIVRLGYPPRKQGGSQATFHFPVFTPQLGVAHIITFHTAAIYPLDIDVD